MPPILTTPTPWSPDRSATPTLQPAVRRDDLARAKVVGGAQPGTPSFLNHLQIPARDAVASGAKAGDVDGVPPAPLDWQSLDFLKPVGMRIDTRPSAFAYDEGEVTVAELKPQPESAQQAMQQFVGETFYGMLLKQMRNTVLESDLLGNSSAKKMFQSQLDQTLVQELALHHSDFLSQPLRI
jgi:hypothetical protein